MSKNKMFDGRGHCEEHHRWYQDTRGCPKCYPERYPGLAPPTDPKRPDVEGIQRAIKGSSTTDPLKYDLANVCNYTLELEAKLKQVEAAYGKAMDQVKAFNQAEVGLVEAVKSFRLAHKEMYEGVNIDHAYNCLVTALKAAETVLEEKKGE